MNTEQASNAAPVYGMVIRCDGCKFWHRIDARDVYQDDGTNIGDDDAVEDGYCKRYPPVVVSEMLKVIRKLPLYQGRFNNMTPSGMLHGACTWPLTYDCDSCGEFIDREL